MNRFSDFEVELRGLVVADQFASFSLLMIDRQDGLKKWNTLDGGRGQTVHVSYYLPNRRFSYWGNF